MSANIKLSKTQIFKTIKSGEFFSRFFGPLMKVGLPLMKNVLIPLELTASVLTVASGADPGTHKKIFDLGRCYLDLA